MQLKIQARAGPKAPAVSPKSSFFSVFLLCLSRYLLPFNSGLVDTPTPSRLLEGGNLVLSKDENG